MRYNRFGFQSNKYNTGNATPFPNPNINITESTNSTTVTYTITSDITHLSNLAYTLSGNAVASDFSDNAISGNIALTDGNATLQKQIVIDNMTDPSFAVQLRDSATGTVFYEGNTFNVTSVGDPTFTVTADPYVRADTGNGTYNGANVTVVRLIQYSFPATIFGLGGTIVFNSLGSGTRDIEILAVGGGGGAGATYSMPYTTNFRSAGGGGGGEHVLTTINTSELIVGANNRFFLGGSGFGSGGQSPNFDGGDGGTTEIGFITGVPGNTSNANISVVGGSGGKGNILASNNAGAGGSSNVSYIAGGNGGNGTLINDANSDGQDGQIGTSYDGWMPFTSPTHTPNVTLANNIIVGSGGGSANSEVGAAPSNVPVQYGFFGTGGSVLGGACSAEPYPSDCLYPNQVFRNQGVLPLPIGTIATPPPFASNSFDPGDGDSGGIQLRWQSVGPTTRTISIA